MHDNEFIERIFHEHYSPLCNYAAKFIGDFNAAEEIVQGLFVEFLEKGNLTAVNQVDRFLIRSTKFKCIDYIRKKKTTAAVPFEQISARELVPVDAPESEEELEALFHYFIAKLPPKTREVFLLIRQSGLSYKEAAEELGLAEKTIENQMSRALKKLRLSLKEYGYIPSLYFATFFQ